MMAVMSRRMHLLRVGPTSASLHRRVEVAGETGTLALLVELWGVADPRHRMAIERRLAEGMARFFEGRDGSATARLKLAIAAGDRWLRRVMEASGPEDESLIGLGAGASLLWLAGDEAILAQAGPSLAFSMDLDADLRFVSPAAPPDALRHPAASPWLRRGLDRLTPDALWPPLAMGAPERLEVHWAHWPFPPGSAALLAPSVAAEVLRRDLVGPLLSEPPEQAARRFDEVLPPGQPALFIVHPRPAELAPPAEPEEDLDLTARFDAVAWETAAHASAPPAEAQRASTAADLPRGQVRPEAAGGASDPFQGRRTFVEPAPVESDEWEPGLVPAEGEQLPLPNPAASASALGSAPGWTMASGATDRDAASTPGRPPAGRPLTDSASDPPFDPPFNPSLDPSDAWLDDSDDRRSFSPTAELWLLAAAFGLALRRGFVSLARGSARVVLSTLPRRSREGADSYAVEKRRLAAAGVLGLPLLLLILIGMMLSRSRLPGEAGPSPGDPRLGAAADSMDDTLADAPELGIQRLVGIEPLTDLTGEPADGRHLVVGGGVALVLNTALDRVDRVGLAATAAPAPAELLVKSRSVGSEVVGAIDDLFWLPPPIEGPDAGAAGRAVALEASGRLWSIEAARVSLLPLPDRPAWTAVSIGAGYEGRLYALDRSTSQIFRYTATGGAWPSFSVDGEPWLSSSQSLSEAIDMAIDGSVYLLMQGGTIRKFAGGQAVDFALSGVPGGLGDAVAIEAGTPAGTILVADRGGRRILALSSEGLFQAQLLRPPQPFATPPDEGAFENLHDLAWDRAGGMLYVIAGKTLYAAPFTGPVLP